MNAKAHEQIVLDIFRQAIDNQPIPDGPHVAEDAELLACWSADLLRPSQSEEIAEHLAVCPYCRRELADMIETGVLDMYKTDNALPGPSTQPQPSRPWYGQAWVPIAIAATILLCLGALLWLPFVQNPDSLLAGAESDLRDGRPLAALDTAEQLLDDALSPSQRARARDLLERAGYRAAGSALKGNDIKQLFDLEDRVTRGAGASGRIVNLLLQAERGVLAASSLVERGCLLDYDYELDGSAPFKEFTPQNKTTKRLMQEFAEAVSDHPDCIPLWLNYGQFLLTYRELERAEEQFAAALRLDDRNVEAHLGLGLVAFETKRYDEALAHFKQVVDSDSRRVDGHINLAVCLERLGRPDEARSYWQRVLGLSGDPQLREQIERHLEN